MDWLIRVISYIFTTTNETDKNKIEALRNMFIELEGKSLAPVIKVESDEKLLIRARHFLETFKNNKGGGGGFSSSFYPAIEKLVNEIDLIQRRWRFKLLKWFKAKV